ncbi:DUF11 domain-containing protein [Luteolibacter arcticus]|uniref:DUF11 domain-containing protein n=1 Tax=Luteolibacter arcticus TaxID=1581411 RepID=A0ABT3GIW7_9BACT|nr:DUF11 domain-containing protein [Luteolibacter arcticus]MCW1923452.1 DUF11 domain-containing protein [Luteolibacter arcticus]
MTLSHLSLALTTCFLAVAGAQPIFQDGFESGLNWTVTKTNDGRARATGDEGPAAGAAHLILDDDANDAVFSVAEASFDLDLTDKKNVTLSFVAKSLGNEAHTPPTGNFTSTRNYDGVAVSCDGGAIWRSVQSLATLGPNWTSFSLPLDSSVTALGGSYGAGFRIRFSAYDNSPAPLDGIAIDSVSVTADEDPRITIELPGTVAEASGPHLGFVSLNIVQATPVTVTLSGSSTALTIPASATIEAGELWASFEFSAPEDSVVTLSRSVTVNASAAGISITPGIIVVTDNETANATLTVPAQLQEGNISTNNATISITPAPAIPVIFSLLADPAAELTIPATVTIQAGQTQAAFSARATNDTKIDGNIAVNVSAAAPGLPPATAVTTTLDNETKTLTLTVPTFVMEGTSGSGTIAITGTLADALLVNLEIVSGGNVSVPASVLIPAGATQVTFPITAVNNSLADGTRTMALTTTAAGFTAATRNVVVRDNDPASYSLSALTDLVPVGTPQSVTVTALDSAGNVISGYAGTVNLDLLVPGGGVLPASPASLTLGGSGWTGTVTLPAITASGLQLRASDTGGRSGLSTAFDPIRSLELVTADLLWSPLREVIYASVPSSATSPYAGHVVEIDPVSMEIRRGVLTIQNPGQLALTSGGEFLYVVQNGNGRVAKIDPVTMTVVSSFAIGLDSFYGTLFAGDICTVAGQPNLLLVTLKRDGYSSGYNGVTVFDDGIARPVSTGENVDALRIEPSSIPTRFWCNSGNWFRTLTLDANGLSVASSTNSLPGGDITSAGDRIYSSTGDVINGLTMTKAGTIASSGPLRPDPILNRVYFLEKTSSSTANYNRIGSYDASNYSLIRQSVMPGVGNTAASLIRWGSNGLAFRSTTHVYLVSSGTLVPSSQPANLAVTVSASPAPATAGQPLTYTVEVKNLGPNLARGVVLSATLSSGQTLLTATSSAGNRAVSGSLVTLLPPDMANNATATLTLTVHPESAGGVSCTAKAVSNVVDPDFSNNSTARLVSVGYLTATDSVNSIRLVAKSLVPDPTRNLLWAALSPQMEAPFRNSVVSINPLNGLVSDPIPLDAPPFEGSIALSGNGRYLYVGLEGTSSFARIDLSQATPVAIRIPFSVRSSSGQLVRDFEVLDGDGTSVLLVTSNQALQVIDDQTPRPVDTSIYEVGDIERTATPGIFFGHDGYTGTYSGSRVAVTATGVEVIHSMNDFLSGGSYAVQISSAGDRMLSDGGHLFDAGTMSMIATLPVYGAECLDGEHNRAYIVNGNALHSFDSDTGEAKGSFSLPVTTSGDWALTCLRWGIDGIAILGEDGKVFVGRWSGIIPEDTDGNADGISDAWAAAQFGTTLVDPEGDGDGDGLADAFEYLFATSPVTAGANPLKPSVEAVQDARSILLRFPRRAGVSPDSYRYQLSEDASGWFDVPSATETVLSTATVDGVTVEQVQVRIPTAWPDRGFARIKWLHP